ncbi:DMP19 family protein [Tabrizicola sp.]|uniref:DMP19 family protein n=1 Tax=Tabrizicola sp. TaxID=2005166 RepID=UPI003F338757
MPIVLCEHGTPPGINTDQPASWQLANLFGAWLPREVEEHLRGLNQKWPLAGLEAQLARAEVTKGQRLLYTASCLQGQVQNGGAEGFAFNCAGLLRDARSVTREMALPELAEAYASALGTVLEVVDRYAARDPWSTGDNLADFWQDFEAVEIDEQLAGRLERAFWAVGGQPNPLSENFAARVVSYALANPKDFCTA